MTRFVTGGDVPRVQFHEVAQELKPYLYPTATNSEYVVALVGDMLREPTSDEDKKLYARGTFNPLKTLVLNTHNQIYAGTRPISKKRAGLIRSRFDGRDFVETIDRLYEADKLHLMGFLDARGLKVALEDLGSAFEDIFKQIFHSLEQGKQDAEIVLSIYEAKPSIRSLAENRIYCEDGKLHIDGEAIELPIRLTDDQIYEFEAGYISALCDVYAEALSRDGVTTEDIPSLPPKYQRNFSNQRKSYLSAESIQRSIREVYEDGENQFDVLKEDAFAGIQTTYFDDYDNGYQRLLGVLNKIPSIQLTKSKLMLISNLIGNLERLGVVHILVNDGTIRSWVDPYEE